MLPGCPAALILTGFALSLAGYYFFSLNDINGMKIINFIYNITTLATKLFMNFYIRFPKLKSVTKRPSDSKRSQELLRKAWKAAAILL